MTPTDDGLLVVIDMQQIFATGLWGAPRFAEIIAPIVRLRNAFGERSVCTRFLAPAKPEGAWQAYYAVWPFALQPTDSAVFELVEPFRGHAGSTVDATTFGKWHGGLEHRVAVGGRLVVAGVSTDCCVLSTVLAAADAGARVQVVGDACAGADDESHERALRVMALYAPLVEIVTVDDILAGER